VLTPIRPKDGFPVAYAFGGSLFPVIILGELIAFVKNKTQYIILCRNQFYEVFMEQTLSASARRFQSALQLLGFAGQVVELSQSTRSAAEAAQAIGCQVEQIVKTLVFRASTSDRAIVVAASGAHRVNEQRISAWLGETITKGDADFVRQRTGYVIGGVPPLGFDYPLLTIIDQDLLQHKELWAAAGTPHAVFRLSPDDLVGLTGGTVLQICP
jgi:prolyl-tRNA editing enzyme YbaK/EbsC (Cys-tRNA(Pro) deacylase)